MAVQGFFERIGDFARQKKVVCLNCGLTNPAGLENCENCEYQLEQPASLFQNIFGLVTHPIKTMRRVAATAPIGQGFLIAIFMTAVLFAFYNIGRYLFFESIAQSQIQLTQAQADSIRQFREAPLPSLLEFVFLGIFQIVGWLFFTAAMYYTGKLLFRDAKLNFYSLLGVAGISRIVNIFVPLLLIQNLNVGGFYLGGIVVYLMLGLQVVLLLIGVKMSTNLNMNRTSIIVIIPLLIFMFFFTPTQGLTLF
jgi:hypothetical protein